MSDPLGPWTEHLRDLTDKSNPDAADDTAARFVHDLYAAAQQDLDEQRAEADFEREE
jgi:hypothetical protein